jgi:patatin-like phospholipase/acyl hydrolase
MARPRFVLSIDGGGMRGIIPAVVLAYLEDRMELPAASAFDLIGGTSTGGILALGLTKPDGDQEPQYSAAQLVDLYKDEGERIFHRSRLWEIRSLGGLADNRYPEGPLEEVLRDHYFGETPMSTAVTEVILTSYDLYGSEPFIFKRSYAREKPEWDYPMWWVARSTSAAPTYFDPFGIEGRLPDEHDHVLADGGVFANNPTLCAYVEALDIWGADTEIVVCSIGTGQKRERQLTKRQVDGWGLANWATTILDTAFDGVSDTVDYQMKIICRRGEETRPTYRRLQIRIPDGMSAALDNATREQVDRLVKLGEELVELEKPYLNELADRLREHSEQSATT